MGYGTDTTKPAWLLQVVDCYDQLHLQATVVFVQDDGELHGCGWSWSERKAGQYDGLRVSAYIGHSWNTFRREDENPSQIWGLSAEFEVSHIRHVDHAKDIASVLGRIEKGLHKMSSEDGYLKDGDYPTYLLRVGKILRIRDIYVRNTRQAREMSGDQFSLKNGSRMQDWVLHAARQCGDGKRTEYVRA